jgi:hypothetical protein
LLHSPPLEDVTSILRRGEIPVIAMSSATESLNSLLDIRVIEYKPGIRYVALSHVWADGLGNPKANTIGLCQFFRIRAMAAAILGIFEGSGEEPDQVCFWIDTLLVPVPSHDREAHQNAMVRMRDVYKNATAVLVIDEELAQHNLPDSPKELFARVVRSSWDTRLWTFQEAALARNLFVVFRNGISSELRTTARAWTSGGAEFASTSAAEAFHWYGSLDIGWFLPVDVLDLLMQHGQWTAAQTAEYGPYFDKFNYVWKGLLWRGVTKAIDECACVGGLLDLDMAALLAVPEDQRWKRLLHMQGRFSSDIIFQDQRRVDEDGMRWAPVTLMEKARAFDLGRRGGDALVSDEGLLSTWPGVVLEKNRFSITAEKDKYVLVVGKTTTPTNINSPDARAYVLNLYIRKEHNLKEWKAQLLDSWAIVLNSALPTGEDDPTTSVRHAALVSMHRKDGGILYAIFRCAASVSLGNARQNRGREDLAGYLGASLRPVQEDQILFGFEVSPEQQWCIG